MSFTAGIPEDPAASRVARGLGAMTREMGLMSVAEGVETSEQAEYLRDGGWQFGQGWLFGVARARRRRLTGQAAGPCQPVGTRSTVGGGPVGTGGVSSSGAASPTTATHPVVAGLDLGRRQVPDSRGRGRGDRERLDLVAVGQVDGHRRPADLLDPGGSVGRFDERRHQQQPRVGPGRAAVRALVGDEVAQAVGDPHPGPARSAGQMGDGLRHVRVVADDEVDLARVGQGLGHGDLLGRGVGRVLHAAVQRDDHHVGPGGPRRLGLRDDRRRVDELDVVGLPAPACRWCRRRRRCARP